MVKEKEKIQCLIFSKKHFDKRKIKKWVTDNGYKIDKRYKHPIMRCDGDKSFKVTQRNSDWFNKKTFKCLNLDKGVKGLYGKLK